jgi:hypothetical protein
MRGIGLAILVLVGVTSTGYAEPVVLAVERDAIFVELGARDGVGAGTELELLHAVTVRDPRSGQVLRDHFALGTLEVVKSGERISMARAEPELAARVIAGDRVRVISPRRRFEDPWARQVAASQTREAQPSAAPRRDTADATELVRRAWLDTLGKAPERRIERWLEVLRGDPHGPYRTAIQAEIASLKAQIAQRDEALALGAKVEHRGPRIAALAAAVLETTEREVVIGGPLAAMRLSGALPGRPIELAFLVLEPAEVARAQLFARRSGEPGFSRIALVADGDAYLRGVIPDGEGDVEWYVEVVGQGGATAPALGSRERPERIAIERVVAEAPISQGRSHVDLHVDYVDFDGKLGGGFDQYTQAEADFSYRFGGPIHVVRLGFGTLSGTGGPKDVIDGDPAGACRDATGTFRCRAVDFSYVYTELELRLREHVAIMLRPQAGRLATDSMTSETRRCRGRDVAGCEFLTGLGVRARLRLGTETGTHLVLGAGFTEQIGTLLEAAYHWLPVGAVPVRLTVQVTDMPVPEDFGVRLIGDIGWRATSWFYPSLRLSYQARDLDHAGVSGGPALNFDW